MSTSQTDPPLLPDTAGEQQLPPSRLIIGRMMRVALPMYPQVLLGLCSNLWGGILVSRYRSPTELAAYGMGVVLTQQTGFSLIWGMNNAVLTVASQAYGAGSYSRVGVTLQRTVLVTLFLIVIPLACLFINAHSVLVACGQPAEVVEVVAKIARIRVPGLVFATIGGAISKTFTAIEKANYVLVQDFVSLGTNVTLSFLLIPHFGALGAAIASVTADAASCMSILAAAFHEAEFRKCWPGFRREAWRNWGSFLKIAVPSMLLLGIEVWVWDAQTFMAGYISPIAQATQSVVPQFTCLMYAMGQAMCSGGATAIGNYLGEGFGRAAKKSAVICISITTCLMFIQLCIFMSLRNVIPHLFTDRPELLESISALLPMCIFFSFIDGHQCALTGILIGVGWQEKAVPLIFTSYWIIAIPVGILLAFGHLGPARHLEGLWIGMILGVCCHVVSFAAAISFIKWPQEAIAARERALAESNEGNEVTPQSSDSQMTTETSLQFFNNPGSSREYESSKTDAQR